MKMITVENINMIEVSMLDNLDLWEFDEKEAEKMLTYIAGIQDMANAVREVLKELGGIGNV